MLIKLVLPLLAFVGLPAAHIYAQTLEVSASGNVGIGTTNPGARLTVVGDIQSLSSATIGVGTGSGFITSSGTQSSLYLV